ncbi:50S ribosomal protein L5, partial [Candidatus Saccharibacteria bacterium]|nr:50S ribosomal protein L5 [Candidatus Saccharibacteria bacterium]
MSQINLKDKYIKARVQLQKELGYNTIMAVPKIRKIVVSSGVGKASADKRYLQDVESVIATITAQKPVVTIAKKSISNFKLRKGMKVGSKVTLRGDKMYWFLERLIDVVLPRIRDFHGLNYKSFDAQGNYNLGFKEHTIFPEIDIDK